VGFLLPLNNPLAIPTPTHTIRPLWFQEAAHRPAEMDKGLSKRISAEEVRRQSNALLK